MNAKETAHDGNKFPDPTDANVQLLFKLAAQMVTAANGSKFTPDNFVASFGSNVAGMLNTAGVLLISKVHGVIHNQLAEEIKQILFGMPVEIATTVNFVNAQVKSNYLHVTGVEGVVGIEDGVRGTVKEMEISKDQQNNTIIVVKATALFGVPVTRTYKFDPQGNQLPSEDDVSGWRVEQ